METFSALLAICAGNSPISGEFPAQRPVTRAFDVSFDLRLNKRWLETLSCSLWRQSNDCNPTSFNRHSDRFIIIHESSRYQRNNYVSVFCVEA